MTFYRQVCQKGLVLIISTFTTFINCFQLFFVSCWAPILHSGCVFLSAFHFHYKKWAFLGFTEHCWLLGWLGTMLSHPTGKHVLSATWILNHKQTQASIHFQGNLEMGIFFMATAGKQMSVYLETSFCEHFQNNTDTLSCTLLKNSECWPVGALVQLLESVKWCPRLFWVSRLFEFYQSSCTCASIQLVCVCLSLSPSASLCLCRVHYWTQ